MRRRSDGHPLVAGLLVASVALLAAGSACPGALAGSFRAHPGVSPNEAAKADASRVARFWTPARMRAARPLGLVVGASGRGRVVAGPRGGGALASFLPVVTPESPPFSVEGKVLIRRRNLIGSCSATAIDSPTRRLVLTAGHCVNSGPEAGHAAIWSTQIEFIPAYSGGVAPFGVFVARRGSIYAPKQWTKQGNPDLDIGAFLTRPNAEGVNVADAVGGGAAIVTDLPRQQEFQTFGYPGEARRMQECNSPYIGDDVLTNPFPGPPTLAIRCRWAAGASGGGWLIGEGTQIDGLSTYLHRGDRSRTYGPYFSAETVGRLVRGL
jgi:hypothetical protein